MNYNTPGTNFTTDATATIVNPYEVVVFDAESTVWSASAICTNGLVELYGFTIEGLDVPESAVPRSVLHELFNNAYIDWAIETGA